MENVEVFPRDGGQPFTFGMCPDPGCTMTLISEDVPAFQTFPTPEPDPEERSSDGGSGRRDKKGSEPWGQGSIPQVIRTTRVWPQSEDTDGRFLLSGKAKAVGWKRGSAVYTKVSPVTKRDM